MVSHRFLVQTERRRSGGLHLPSETMVEIATDVFFFSGKLIQAISCSANGISLGHHLFRIAMEAVGGLASSAVAEMMFQRASVDVCTCVHRTHALLDGLQVDMGQRDHRFICNPRLVQRCPLAQSLPLVPLYIQGISRHQLHVTRSCGHSPRSPQLRGPMQQTQVTRSSPE